VFVTEALLCINPVKENECFLLNLTVYFEENSLFIPRSNSLARLQPVPGNFGDFVDAVFRPEIFRILPDAFRPVPVWNHRKLAGIHRKKSEQFLAGMLLPYSICWAVILFPKVTHSCIVQGHQTHHHSIPEFLTSDSYPCNRILRNSCPFLHRLMYSCSTKPCFRK